MNISVSLNIFEYGNPHGTPLILIHGGAGGVWTWEETVKHLGEYRCLLPELPEHGSSQSSGPFSIRATAAQIIQYIRQQIPGGKAHIAGLSVGGQVAIEMLGLAPEAVLSAVVSGALAFPLPGYRLGLYSEAAMTLLYWLGVFPWKKNDAWIRLNMKTMSGMPESSFQAFKRNFQSLTRSGWAHAMSEFYRYRLPEGLETVETPVLLVAGVHEKRIPSRPTACCAACFRTAPPYGWARLVLDRRLRNTTGQ